MVPYIKKTTGNLVTVMGEKEATGEAFNVCPYVRLLLLIIIVVYMTYSIPNQDHMTNINFIVYLPIMEFSGQNTLII